MRRAVIAGYSTIAAALLIALGCSGCVISSLFLIKDGLADKIAFGAGFTKAHIQASSFAPLDGEHLTEFTLTVYYKFTSHQKPLRVYIEGDGCAWESRRRLSLDPTPAQPTALRLAVLDTYDNVAYIARPGQYSASNLPSCDPAYWSQKRFALEVVNSIGQVIDRLKKDVGVSGVELVGYSGGGALAVLVASKRTDVLSIRTVAGNLDHEALCKYHRVSPLTGSLNPIDAAQSVAGIPQYHFVGLKDDVVPPFIAERFFRASGCASVVRVIYVSGVSHTKGWCEHWQALLNSARIKDGY